VFAEMIFQIFSLLRAMKNKKGFEMQYLGWLLIGLAVLVIAGAAYILAAKKQGGLACHIKNLFGGYC
jgi:hypothetical protein